MDTLRMWEYETLYCKNPHCQSFGSASEVQWANNDDVQHEIYIKGRTTCRSCGKNLGSFGQYLRNGGLADYEIPTAMMTCHNKDCCNYGEAHAHKFDHRLTHDTLVTTLGMSFGRCEQCGKPMMLTEDFDAVNQPSSN